MNVNEQTRKYLDIRSYGDANCVIFGCQECAKDYLMTALEFNDLDRTIECREHGVVWPRQISRSTAEAAHG